MCAATKSSNKKIPDKDDRQGVFRCPGSGYYPDLMLEAMQTSVIFFNNDGQIHPPGAHPFRLPQTIGRPLVFLRRRYGLRY